MNQGLRGTPHNNATAINHNKYVGRVGWKENTINNDVKQYTRQYSKPEWRPTKKVNFVWRSKLQLYVQFLFFNTLLTSLDFRISLRPQNGPATTSLHSSEACYILLPCFLFVVPLNVNKQNNQHVFVHYNFSPHCGEP